MNNKKDVYALMIYDEICSENGHLLVYTNSKQALAKMVELQDVDLTYKHITLEEYFVHELRIGGDNYARI